MKYLLLKKALFLSLIFAPIFASAQVEFSLALSTDSTTWEAYARMDSSVAVSDDVELAAGQFTIVVPTGTNLMELKSINGSWEANARANRPIENPNYDYVSFGYQRNFPFDAFATQNEVLLFTFELFGCPDSIALMDNGDPFARPNSNSTNPENDFQAIDRKTFEFYQWTANYNPCDWDCLQASCKENPQVSTNKELNASQISIFPNPTTGILHFNDFESSISKIAVRNVFGQTVFQTENPDGQIDLSHLKNGSYFLFFENEKADFQTKHIIIQK